MGDVLLSVSINIVILLIAYLFFRRRIRRLLNGAEFIDSVKDEVNHLVVELNQNADRNIGILEERIVRLQKLVEDADKKILLLGEEREKMNISVDVYDRLKRSAPLVEKTPQSPVFESEVESKPVIEEMTGAEEVIYLHRQGIDSRLIATRTGSTLGEVELIISLEDGKK